MKAQTKKLFCELCRIIIGCYLSQGESHMSCREMEQIVGTRRSQVSKYSINVWFRKNRLCIEDDGLVHSICSM